VAKFSSSNFPGTCGAITISCRPATELLPQVCNGLH